VDRKLEAAPRTGAILLDLAPNIRKGVIVSHAARSALAVRMQPEPHDTALAVDRRGKFRKARLEGAPAVGCVVHGARLTPLRPARHPLLAPFSDLRVSRSHRRRYNGV